MPSAMRARAVVVAMLLGAVPGIWAAGRNQPLTTAELLVDLARDHALVRRGQQTEADVQTVRTLLRAALRLDPQLTDAYVWLYELATLAGDQAAAGQALTGLLNADPTNQNAFALWLAAGARVCQTAEARAEWLQAVLQTPRPPALQAMVHVELARLELERVDLAAAQRHLDRAFELEPTCVAAAALALHALGDEAPAVARLKALLRLLAAHPAELNVAWQVGQLLDEHGLPADATRFYDYAAALHARSSAQTPPGGRYLLDLARNRRALGRLDEAVELARRAIATDPVVAAEAGMLLAYLVERQGAAHEAEQIRAQLSRRFASLNDPAAWPVNEVAQAAWFYTHVAPDPHRAATLAEAAAQKAPGDPFVQRVLGWAQALNLKPDEALRTLAPLARRDPYAAYMLAKLRREAGDESGARQCLDALETPPVAGPARDLIDAFLSPVPASQPATDSAPATPATQPVAASQPMRRPDPELVAALAAFDARVLTYYDDPGRYVEARVTLDDLSPAPGEPWLATFALTNRGPFPVTLGPEAMANPVFMLSFRMEGDRTRSFPALQTVSVDRVRVLYPGQSVQVRRTIDVGPIRQASRQTPQQAQRIEVQVLLDAELGADGQWRASLGGQQLRPPVYFNRLPAATGREALTALLSAIGGGSDAARWRAIELAAELLGERQRADLKRLNYAPGPVPVDRLRAVLLDLLRSEAWERRVRTLDALQMMGLDREFTAAVESCLAHEHWLVRLMAVRVLARQGREFAARAESLARDDADELVRALAASYVEGWRLAGPAASAPATE